MLAIYTTVTQYMKHLQCQTNNKQKLVNKSIILNNEKKLNLNTHIPGLTLKSSSVHLFAY